MKTWTEELKSMIVIILILCVVSALVMGFLMGEFNVEAIGKQFFFNFYYGFPLGAVNGFFFNRLSTKFPWQEHPKKRTWFGVIGSIVLTMFTLVVLNIILWVLIQGHQWSSLLNQTFKNFYVIALIITVIISSILHAIEFFKQVEQEKRINETLRKEKISTELNMLKAHLDPHFLFNSFNVLSGLIDENPENAQHFLSKLSSIYRYILETRDEDLSVIKDELDFAKKYLALQQTRFEDAIVLKWSIDEDILNQRIPSLTLQLLLENAIKHNGFSKEKPLVIELFSEDDCLIIRNNKQERTSIQVSNKLGLQNIKDRYQLMTQKDIIIEDLMDSFTVKVPLI